METLQIKASQAGWVEQALAILNTGGLVAFPTDTVYGLGALAFDQAAVESIYTVKDRSLEKAIPILISDIEDMERVTLSVPAMATRLAAHFWPGPLTLIVPKHPKLPQAISATPGVAIRIPDHPLALELLRLAGPLAVTSANLSGQPNCTSAGDVTAQLNGRIPLILDGGRTPGGIPSTLVDCMSAEPIVLRDGPVSLDDISRVLANGK